MATLFLQIVTVSHLPESPRWLLAKKTPTDCSQALRVFRRSTETSREFSDITAACQWICLVWMQQWTGIHLITLFVIPLIEEMITLALPSSSSSTSSASILLNITSVLVGNHTGNASSNSSSGSSIGLMAMMHKDHFFFSPRPVSPLLLLALIMLAGLTGSAIAGRVVDKTGRRALLLMGYLTQTRPTTPGIKRSWTTMVPTLP
eukprot:scaffold7194_cov181-Ochromonas_danica.AAC.4